ncbi:SPASM domain-containing protein [bacterium]|nr:SPASM domain-containing protein [bacterium]
MKPLPVLEKSQVTTEVLKKWPLEYIRHLHVEMGQQCNVRCSMCYQVDFSPATRLPDVVWKEHLAPAYGHLSSLTMQGGEPTVLPNCRDLLQNIVKNHPQISLDTVTNGVQWKGLWEDAFLAQGSCVNFSLNAISRELYENIVQFGRYDEVVGNIDRMVHRKRQTSSQVILRTSTVVLAETIHELPRFIEWSAEHGLDQVIFHTDTVLSAKPGDGKRVQGFIGEAYEMAERHPEINVLSLNEFDWFYSVSHRIDPVRPRALFSRPRGACPLAFDTLFVSYTGLARPCCKSWFRFGNLKAKPVEEVWNSRAAMLFRSRMLSGDFRDCTTVCDLNTHPINQGYSDARRFYWLVKSEPRQVRAKVARKLGLTSAQHN